ARGVRDQELATVTCRGDACGAVDVKPDVVVATGDALTGVEAHPHPYLGTGRPAGGRQRPLAVDRCPDRRARIPEDHQKGVALGAALDTAVCREGCSEQAMVLLEK